MKRKQIAFVFFSVLIILGLSLASCTPTTTPQVKPTEAAQEDNAPTQEAPTQESAAQQEEITLLVWDQFGEGPVGEAVQKIYDGFTAKNPNIKIVKEVYSMEQLATTARTALASGSGPDIIYNDITPARELIKADLLIDMETYSQQYGWRDRFYPTGLSWTEMDGKLWGLGAESEFVGIFVNHTLFEKEGLQVPQTISEALEFCKVAKERGYVALAHSQNPGWQNFFSFTMPIHNYVGVDYMEKLLFDHEGAWNTPEMVRAMETFYVDMKDAGCFVDDMNGLGYDGAIDMFTTGEAFMFPTGTWMVDGLLEMAKTNEVDMMPWFDMETGQPRMYTMGMGSAYFVSANSKYKNEAGMFLDYVFSDEAVKIWIEEAARIPPVKVDASALTVAPLQQFVVNTLKEAGLGEGGMKLGWDVDLIVPEEFNQMLTSGWQAVFGGDKTVSEQMDDLQGIWEKHLSQ